MQKDFDTWNERKKRIDSEKQNRFYHAREVWWCSLGINVGDEHDGTGNDFQRPVLLLSGLSMNTCMAVPLTSSTKEHRFRIPVGMVDGKHASAVLTQMRTIDTKRLTYRVCFIDQEAFEKARKAAKDML